MLKSLGKQMVRLPEIENLCVDDFLAGMGAPRGNLELENCKKVRRLLRLLISGVDERLHDIMQERSIRVRGISSLSVKESLYRLWLPSL